MNDELKNSLDDSLDKTISMLRHNTLRCELHKKGVHNPMDIYYHHFIQYTHFKINNHYFDIRDSVKRKYK